MKTDRRREQGFTLIELMLVVGIMGILASISMPYINDWLLSAKVRTVTTDLYSSLIKARSEAIKRNRDVVIAPQTGTDWKTGWTVKQAATTLDQHQQVADDLAIVIKQKSGGAWSAFPGNLTFKNTGRLDVTADEVAYVVTTATGWVRCVNIGSSGRPSVRADLDRNANNACD